jgi:hypothetical protein
MKYFILKQKTFLLYLVFTFFSIQIIYADNISQQNIAEYTYNSTNVLGSQFNSKDFSNSNLKFKFNNRIKSFDTSLSLNFESTSHIDIDGSYFQYNKGPITFGIGFVERNWSFSPNTSLILSENAPPMESIYFLINDKIKDKYSLEIFNGKTKNSPKNHNSKFLGFRIVTSPVKNLKIELLQTSQWGGSEYSESMSALSGAILMDTNDGKNSNINKMAGFGISYLIENKIIPFKLYAQLIGEDEAGSLPSCYIYMSGIESKFLNGTSLKKLGLEFIDTRVKKTEHGYCGPNTAYNNGIYKYTNNNLVLGAPIDTEGTSIEIYGENKLNESLSIKYSIKKAIINDSNWNGHRLSAMRETGLIKYLSIVFKKDGKRISSNIYQQGIALNKANYTNKIGVGFTASLDF